MRCGPATIPPQTFAQVDPHPRPVPATGRGEEGAGLREQTVSLEASRLLLLAGKETLLLANEYAGSVERAVPSPLRGVGRGGGATPGPSRFSADPQLSRLYPQRRVGRSDDQAALGEMITHQGGKQALSGGVEGIGRLIQ